jgi:hypothetical protein
MIALLHIIASPVSLVWGTGWIIRSSRSESRTGYQFRSYSAYHIDHWGAFKSASRSRLGGYARSGSIGHRGAQGRSFTQSMWEKR